MVWCFRSQRNRFALDTVVRLVAIMLRLLICIPFLVFFALLYPRGSEPVAESSHEETAVVPLRPDSLLLLSSAPLGSFPSDVPWAGIFQAAYGKQHPVESLPDPDILTFLQMCIDRYQREVTGYRCILDKQERVGSTPSGGGRLLPPESVTAEFREHPFSVHMKWLRGAGLAQEVLYVKGQNNGKMLVKLSGIGLVWPKSLDDPQVKQSGRYGIEEFGMLKGIARTLHDWKEARAEGKLNVKYEGVYQVAQVGNRSCYKIHRTGYPDPEGIADVILYIDTERWLQVGSILRGEQRQLIGEYFFRDIEMNPSYPPSYFSRNLLNKK